MYAPIIYAQGVPLNDLTPIRLRKISDGKSEWVFMVLFYR